MSMQGIEGQLKEFLHDAGLLSRAQLGEAEQRAQERGEPLARTLVDSGVLNEEEVRRAVAHASGIPYVSLSREDIDISALLLVPEPLCRAHNVVAFASSERGVEIALLDLDDLSALDFLKHHGRVLPRLTSRESLRRALLLYQKQLKERFDSQLSSAEGGRSLEALLAHALVQGASAVHLDLPTLSRARVRYRIGGALHEAMVLAPEKASRIATELKTLAGFSAATSVPQEVRLRLTTPEPLSVRFSVMPVAGGEKIVLNLVPERESRKGFTLETLGLHGEALEAVQRLLHQKTGLLVVAGPEGSGITTTLYTLLDLLNHPRRAIASVERQVEYRLPPVSQTEINESVGLSPTAAVRGALRQDPDVLTLADIEDEAALALAQQAAGRCFVVVGGELAEVSAADAVIGQRLVRRLCQVCREEHTLTRTQARFLEERADFARTLATLKEEEVVGKDIQWKEVRFWRAVGCGQCEAGYQGSIGLFEVAVGGAMPFALVEDGLFKAAAGLTDIDEVVRVASEGGK